MVVAGCAAAVVVPAGSAAAQDAATQLVFTRSEPGTQIRTVTLTCAPAGGSHPDPAGACDSLADAGLTLPEPNPEMRCLRYDPVELRAHGTLRGDPVSVERTYDCGAPALPAPWQF